MTAVLLEEEPFDPSASSEAEPVGLLFQMELFSNLFIFVQREREVKGWRNVRASLQ